jgi:hypothetical protein
MSIAAFMALVTIAFLPSLGSQQSPGIAPKPAPNLSDENLKKFAMIVEDIMEIREAYREKLSRTEDAAKEREIEQMATADMVAAVRERNMETDEYNQIAHVVNSDPQVFQRFTDIHRRILEEARKGQDKNRNKSQG